MHHLYINFLLTATAFVATPSSFGQWVSEFPMCAWSCLDNYFNEQLASKCGPNAKFSMNASDVECICTADNSSLQMSQSANELTACLSSQCAASRDARGFQQAVNDIIPMCMWAAQGKHADAASLDAPHFVVAIGIVVFSGVVLW